MKAPLAVINCAQLVTLGGPNAPRTGQALREPGIVPDGALLVRGGRIEAAGTMRELAPQIGPEYEVVDARGCAVLPGFVDAHTHPVFAGTRVDEYEMRLAGATYEQIAAAGGGIRSTVARTREASSGALLANARKHASWFLRTGTTTIEAKSGYTLTVEGELRLLRVIRALGEERRLHVVPTFLGAHEVPPEFAGRRAEYADLVAKAMLPAVAAESLARYCDVFCEPSVFDVPTARRILTRARELGLGLRVHADQLRRAGAAELAASLGAATADHLEQIGSEGIAALASAGVQPVLLPGSVYALGLDRYAPARAMIEAGLAVVIATDFNPGSSPIPSMPLILSLACNRMKMTPAEALTAATINAACSLALGHRTGSLAPGKWADFVIHDCSDYREIVYYAGHQSARAVYVEGDLAQ